MDPLTHLAAGILIGHVGATICPEPAATLTAIAGAILPDVDFYARRYEGSRFLKVHHGATHSGIGIIAQTAIVAIPAWLFFNHVPIMDFKSPSLLPLLAISFFSVFTHIFLDWVMHNNGLPLLWPFSEKRFCFPLILGVNPRTVSHDCGEKRYLTCFGCQSRGGFFNPISWILTAPAIFGFFIPHYRTAIGIIPWLITAGYLGLCYVFRECARKTAIRVDPNMKNAHAYPARARPNRWQFIYDHDDGAASAILSDCLLNAVLRQWKITCQPLSPDIAQAVETIHKDLTYTIRHVCPVEIPLSSGTLVEFHDLSYLSAEPTEIGTVRVTLDSENRVLREVYQEIW